MLQLEGTLPVREIAEYARTQAVRMRIRDAEEAESVAVAALAEADASNSENPMGYYKLYAKHKIMRHFFDCKSPGLLPEGHDIEYDDQDHVANIIEGMKLSPREQRIINLRMGGYNDPEIGLMLNCSRQLITKIRAEMKRRYRDLSFLH